MGLDGVGFVRADYPGNRTGDHTSNIFCAAGGPGIAPGHFNAPLEVMDFAPTVATILGVDSKHAKCGRPLSQCGGPSGPLELREAIFNEP